MKTELRRLEQSAVHELGLKRLWPRSGRELGIWEAERKWQLSQPNAAVGKESCVGTEDDDVLRLLQDGQFQRVGGNETMTVDVRIIAATHQNLGSMIQRGQFRNDLYYRLRGVTLDLPPLRERIEDLPELAHYFLFRFNRQLGTMVQSISAEVLDLFES